MSKLQPSLTGTIATQDRQLVYGTFLRLPVLFSNCQYSSEFDSRDIRLLSKLKCITVGVPPVRSIDPAEFTVNIGPLIKAQPAGNLARPAGRAIGNLGIGMEAGTFQVSPCPMQRLPSHDDPTRPGAVVDCGHWREEYFVVVGLNCKPDSTFQHRTHLHAEIAQRFSGSIRKGHSHPDAIPIGLRPGLERDSVRESSFERQ